MFLRDHVVQSGPLRADEIICGWTEDLIRVFLLQAIDQPDICAHDESGPQRLFGGVG
jgi:hypothetical protein